MNATPMPKFFAANWKENPKSEAKALTLFKATASVKRNSHVGVAVCPPFIYLEEISHAYKRLGIKKGLALGAQDVFSEEKGPFTGGVGPKMLKSLGAKYVIVGHSERRKWMHETDAMINKKIRLALADGLTVILCVGEPLSIRKKGIGAAKKFIGIQLAKDLKTIKPGKNNLVVAYEPIWAIGTGHYDKPEDARAMATFIKKLLNQKHHQKARFLYGGSVNSKNIADYVQYEEIDGALVGGASLKADECKKIITILSKI